MPPLATAKNTPTHLHVGLQAKRREVSWRRERAILEDVHRVKVAANNALDLRGAVFDAMLLAVMPPSEEVDVGWVVGGGRHLTTWLSALEVELK